MELTERNLRQHPALYFDASALDNPPGSFVRVRHQPFSGTYAVTLTGLENGAMDWSEECFVFDTFQDLLVAFGAWGEHLHLRDTWRRTAVVTDAAYFKE